MRGRGRPHDSRSGDRRYRPSGAEARGFLRSFRRATHALRGFPGRALIQSHRIQRRRFPGFRIETRGTPCRGGLTGAGVDARTTAGLETGATGRQGLKPGHFLRSFRRATHTLCGFPGRALIQSHRIQRRWFPGFRIGIPGAPVVIGWDLRKANARTTAGSSTPSAAHRSLKMKGDFCCSGVDAGMHGHTPGRYAGSAYSAIQFSAEKSGEHWR